MRIVIARLGIKCVSSIYNRIAGSRPVSGQRNYIAHSPAASVNTIWRVIIIYRINDIIVCIAHLKNHPADRAAWIGVASGGTDHKIIHDWIGRHIGGEQWTITPLHSLRTAQTAHCIIDRSCEIASMVVDIIRGEALCESYFKRTYFIGRHHERRSMAERNAWTQQYIGRIQDERPIPEIPVKILVGR